MDHLYGITDFGEQHDVTIAGHTDLLQIARVDDDYETVSDDETISDRDIVDGLQEQAGITADPTEAFADDAGDEIETVKDEETVSEFEEEHLEACAAENGRSAGMPADTV